MPKRGFFLVWMKNMEATRQLEWYGPINGSMMILIPNTFQDIPRYEGSILEFVEWSRVMFIAQQTESVRGRIVHHDLHAYHMNNIHKVFVIKHINLIRQIRSKWENRHLVSIPKNRSEEWKAKHYQNLANKSSLLLKKGRKKRESNRHFGRDVCQIPTPSIYRVLLHGLVNIIFLQVIALNVRQT